MRLIRKLPKLLRRDSQGHKGDYGRVLVVAGSRTMHGAASLTCQGALRGGAGLVHLATPQPCAGVLATMLPCCIVHPMAATMEGSLSEAARGHLVDMASGVNVVAMGPGLTTSDETRRLVITLVQELGQSLVLDADGLNAVAENLYAVDRSGKALVLTPHPGEMARLAGLPSSADVQGNRMKTAMVFAERYDLIVVLKGHGTIVTDGKSVFVNPTGNPGMATGGVGDVLTGVIAALIGQGLSALDASVLGVYVHGLAGDLAARQKGQVSLIASDVVDFLPQAFLALEKEDYEVVLPG